MREHVKQHNGIEAHEQDIILMLDGQVSDRDKDDELDEYGNGELRGGHGGHVLQHRAYRLGNDLANPRIILLHPGLDENDLFEIMNHERRQKQPHQRFYRHAG